MPMQTRSLLGNETRALRKRTSRYNQHRDLSLVEEANLTGDMKLIATTTVSSLYYLKTLSSRLGIPIEDISAEHIIVECSRADVEIRDLRRQYDAWLLGIPN